MRRTQSGVGLIVATGTKVPARGQSTEKAPNGFSVVVDDAVGISFFIRLKIYRGPSMYGGSAHGVNKVFQTFFWNLVEAHGVGKTGGKLALRGLAQPPILAA